MTRLHHGLTRYDQLVKSHIDPSEAARRIPLPATFGRLAPANEVQLEHTTHAQLIDIFERLALAMARTGAEPGAAPAGMTFFGQFVDHDVTLDATSALGSRIVPATIPNVRTPALDLDCVYGAGPEASPHLYGRDEAANMLVYGNAANPHDLARTANGTALIGDPRNDENGIISAIQANFVALHNILMTEALNDAAARAEMKDCARMGMAANDWTDHVADRHMIFEEVRRFIRLHYQHVVWTELLPAFVDRSCLDEAMVQDLFGADAAIMPVEFSGAAYRFGHATTQPGYAMKQGNPEMDMFTILGFGPRVETPEMRMFFDIQGAAPRARPVGPALGEPLTRLPFINTPVHLGDINHTLTVEQSRNLPLRNILRDRYTYKLANGEWFRTEWFKKKLKRTLPAVEMDPILSSAGVTKTPLWYYSLQEAAQHGGGRLTGVGGAIVASVFGRLLRLDPTTVWHASGFAPSAKFAHPGGVLAGMMAYAEAHRDGIAHAALLKNG
ncbi:peroxidase family protein [Thetidibacter halocola]|uniref:Peroxidase n=1 Tax=Thetidibacter halocola TaxID=2827239 RepID=A0A8J7WF84_9RHOB|nr:peroxidase family protein [Thetidibacter halocola]MBS0123973.1 hypothetical protein [Thetidibacter halocola]